MPSTHTRLSAHGLQDCAGGARVMQCLYDGIHGQWPTQPGGDDLVWWFATRIVNATRARGASLA